MFSEEYSPLTTLLAIMGPGHVSHQAVAAWGGGGRPGGGGNTMMVTPGAERVSAMATKKQAEAGTPPVINMT